MGGNRGDFFDSATADVVPWLLFLFPTDGRVLALAPPAVTTFALFLPPLLDVLSIAGGDAGDKGDNVSDAGLKGSSPGDVSSPVAEMWN